MQCCHSTDRDLDRLNRDLSTLREHKKRLEDAVMVSVLCDRCKAYTTFVLMYIFAADRVSTIRVLTQP